MQDVDTVESGRAQSRDRNPRSSSAALLPGLAAILALLLPPHTATALIHCVKPGGGSGCHPTILAALALANDGDTIRIAAGTYPGSLVITKNITLEGGWNATFSDRNPSNPGTIVVPELDDLETVIAIRGVHGDSGAITPTIDGLVIASGRANLGRNQGGGLRVIDSDARVQNCWIVGNTAYLQGGGVWVQRSSPTFKDCQISDNSVAGGPLRLGAGLAIESGSASLTRCLIARNEVNGLGLGGGISILNVAFERDQYLRVTDSVIENNSAGAGGLGGGIAAQILDTPAPGTAGVFLERVRITGNEADTAAALSVEEAAFEITNSVISGNFGDSGNAILATDFSATASLSPGSVRNSTLVGNGSSSAIETDSRLELVNSIVTNHSTGIFYWGPAGGLVLRHNDFFANGVDVSAGAGFALDPSNLRVDPRLDAALRLLPGSPLIDAGTRTSGPFEDLDGESRPAAGPSGRFAFDVGADEAPGEAQRVFDVGRGEFDLAFVGPGAERGGTPQPSGAEAIGHALLGADWSGDGIDDFLVAARDWGRGLGLLGSSARRLGAIDAWLGPPPPLELVAEAPNLRSLAAGRLRGTGGREIALGSGAAVFVVPAGPGLAGVRDLTGASALRVLAPAPNHAFARAGALAIGDVSGDGIDDLLIGDAQADDGAAADSGAVFAIFGSPALAGVRNLAASPAELTIRGSGPGSALGGALALGDLDGDGDLDLAAGDASRVHVLLGPLAPGVRRLASAPADARIENLPAAQLVALDLTGEGRTDLVGGSGPLRLIAGPLSAGQVLDANTSAALVLTSAAAPESLHAADVAGDARAELLVGLAGSAYAISSGVRASGTVPLDQLASLALSDAAAGSLLGGALAAGDLDADGRRDWLISDPAAPPLEPHPEGASDAGRVYAIYGGLAADNCPGISNPGQADSDADGAGDACDVCAFNANPDQRDLGGAANPGDPTGSASDSIGDSCQCGDASGDGRANATDLAAIRRALGGGGTPATAARCNVRGPVEPTPDLRTGVRRDCSLVDAVVLARQIAGRAPGIAQVCEPALP